MTKSTLREELAHKCITFKEKLKLIITPQLSEESGYEKYNDRYEKLDEALQDFIDHPSNFDSRHTPGLAEKIYKAVPVYKMLMGNEELFFKLSPGGYEVGEFEPSNLAIVMGKAYRKELIVYDSPNKEKPIFVGLDYKQYNYDLIYSELANFFDGIQFMLRNSQADKYLATQRKKNENKENYEKLALDRAKVRDPNLMNLFARKCCKYCFRLVATRYGRTKASTGSTCSLHDPKTNPGLYKIAKKQNDKIILWDEQNIARDKGGEPYFNPHHTPKTLNIFMSQALAFNNWNVHSDPIFNLTIKLLTTKPNKKVDECILEQFKNCIIEDYPPIASPGWLADSVQKLKDGNRHTAENLKILLTVFIKDDHLPFHPKIIALYMVLFKYESWYVEEFERNYYNISGTKGRPFKINHNAVLVAANKLKSENPNRERYLASILALQFGCTPTLIRKIIHEK